MPNLALQPNQIRKSKKLEKKNPKHDQNPQSPTPWSEYSSIFNLHLLGFSSPIRMPYPFLPPWITPFTLRRHARCHLYSRPRLPFRKRPPPHQTSMTQPSLCKLLCEFVMLLHSLNPLFVLGKKNWF